MMPSRRRIGADTDSSFDSETMAGDELVVERQTETGAVVDLKVPVGRRRFAVEDVPEEGVAVRWIEEREEFGDRRVEVSQNQVIVVHLAGMGENGETGAGRHRPDLARLG